MNPMRYLWHLLRSGFRCIQKQFWLSYLQKLCPYRTAHINTNKNHKMSWYTELVFLVLNRIQNTKHLLDFRAYTIEFMNDIFQFCWFYPIASRLINVFPPVFIPPPFQKRALFPSYKIHRIIFDYRLPYIPLAQLISWCKMDWVIPNVSYLNGGKVYKFSNIYAPRRVLSHTQTAICMRSTIFWRVCFVWPEENCICVRTYVQFVAGGRFLLLFEYCILLLCVLMWAKQTSCCENCTFILSFNWCVLFLLNN